MAIAVLIGVRMMFLLPPWLAHLSTRLWQICLFQSGPQDLSPAKILLYGLILCNFITGFLAVLPIAPWYKAMLDVGIGLVLLMGFVYAVLWVYRRPARFLQTMMAFAGTGIYFNLMVALILWPADWDNQVKVISDGLLFSWLTVMLWSSAVMIMILKHALETGVSISMAYLIVYGLLNWEISTRLLA